MTERHYCDEVNCVNARLIYSELHEKDRGHWADRILTELEYLRLVFVQAEEKIPEILDETAQNVYEAWQRDGAITRQTVLEAEKALKCFAPRAKALKQLCVAHAHIDMDWLWGKAETVSVTIDTFQTMLNLLREYPDFIYSQSQASTYEIIEKYCPSMLDEIKQRVKEGRWELTASTWVECDKNMSGAESMARHILYTKDYLSKMFDVSPESLELDFEPDTFGHAAPIPEILSNGGVKYYYFCRGHRGHEAFRWQAPSGAQILTLRDPIWYHGDPESQFILRVPAFCKTNYTDTALYLYGVGDHGGGPTRRDIERIIDMGTWPLGPDVRFGRLKDFFHALEKNIDKLPVYDNELNFVFTGCYTTQSRIKRANRIGEDRLYDTDALSVMWDMTGGKGLNLSGIKEGWRNTLFNQFHDILPGSGVFDTYTHALGLFQETLSHCNANSNRAMRWISDNIDTTAFDGVIDPHSNAAGAGAGYCGMSSISVGCHVGSGPVRVYTLFNTTQYDRDETISLTIWDWPWPLRQTDIVDAQGNTLPYDLIEDNPNYWRHTYKVLSVKVKVPALGYTTVAVRYNDEERSEGEPLRGPRTCRLNDAPIVLENELIRAMLDPVDMKLISLVDKRTAADLITPERPAGYFRLVAENDRKAYSAWTIGEYGKVDDLNAANFINRDEVHYGASVQYVDYKLAFANSSVKVRISLANNSPVLRYSVEADWHEIGKQGGVTPQLQFYVPFAFEAKKYRYDVPGGVIDRVEAAHDVPAIAFAAAVPENCASTLGITTDCKYGYRGYDNSLTVTLLRSSYNPDPYPDLAMHPIEIGIAVTPGANTYTMIEDARRFAHPILTCSAANQKGKLPLNCSFMKIDGNAKLSALKISEDEKAIVARIYQPGDKTETVKITPVYPVTAAWEADVHERKKQPISVEDNTITLEMAAGTLHTIIIETNR